MLKTRKRWISLVLTLAMLVAFCVPFVGPAAADSGYRAAPVPNVDDSDGQTLGTLIAQIDGGTLANGDAVTFRLPDDFTINTLDITIPTALAGNTNELNNGATDITGTWNYVYANSTVGMLDFTKLSDNEFKVALNATPVSGKDAAIFKIKFTSVDVKSGFDGDIKVIADAPSNSGFPSGEVVIARVPGGKVELSVTNAPTFSDNTTSDPVKIRVKETTSASIELGSSSKSALKFKLPDGFEWAALPTTPLTRLWGDDIKGLVTTIPAGAAAGDKYLLASGIGDRELKINLVAADGAGGYSYVQTATASAFEMALNVQVSDETRAKTGDVVATVGGESTVNVSEVTVGKYGEFHATIVPDGDIPTVKAGMLDQDSVDLKIKEDVAGSLAKDRTIILTLPENAKWTQVDENGDSDSSLILSFVGPIGDEGRSIKYKVDQISSGDAAELTLEDMQVAVEPGFTGDLKVTVSGTAGLTGDVTIAKVVAPISISASATPDIKIGLAGQAAGDLTITESEAGAIKSDEYVKLDLPDGVSFANVPTVEVTAGDLSIDQSTVKRANDGDFTNNQLWFKVKSDSLKASTIKISNIKLTADRTVPEGPITVKVKGAAVAEVNDQSAIEGYFGTTFGSDNEYTVQFDSQDAYTLTSDDLFFPNSTSAAQTELANVITPAPGEQTGTVVFKIGEAKYTLNGTEVTMDAAPYISGDRTFMPVRYAANALGVADTSIIWDQATRKVTVMKGDRVVQMTIGSKVMTINGAEIYMDVAPEIQSDRTMLPISWLGKALGADFTWDQATQTVTVNF